MSKKINHLPVNWTDGAKINSEHFFNTYKNTIETIKDYNSVTLKNYEYGLLESSPNFENLELDILTDGENSLTVKLKSCNAITQKGYRVIYHSDLYGEEDAPFVVLKASDFNKTETEVFYVIVSIAPFDYVPVGQPDPEVLPLHHPNVLPKFKLHIIPISQLNTGFLEEHFLVVSKISWVNGLFSIDQNYIPPVINVLSNDKLKNFGKSLLQVLLNVKSYTIKIAKKNNRQKNNNTLVANTFLICESIQEYYCDSIFGLENITFKKSPIYLTNDLVVLANKLAVCLSIMDDKEKEQLLQYYYQWTDIKPSDLIDAIVDVVNIKYNHIEISEALYILNKFVAILERILKKMSELEYIGQRKDNIVVNEESNPSFNKNRDRGNSWSIID